MNKKYQKTLKIIVDKIMEERQTSIELINLKLIELYWEIGNMLLCQKEEENLGNDIIKKLSVDLSKKFPDMKGFSARNIKYMIKFAKTYEQYSLLKELLCKLSWSHHIVLMQKVKNEEERLWYINTAIEYNWTVDIMNNQIEQNLYGKVKNSLYHVMPIKRIQTFENRLNDSYVFDLILLLKQDKKNKVEGKIPSIDDIEKMIDSKFQYYMDKMKEDKTKNEENKRHGGIDYVRIGENIRNARKNKHYTQEDMSQRLDVSVAFYSRIERGTSQINLKRLSQICEILDISEGEVLNTGIKRRYLEIF